MPGRRRTAGVSRHRGRADAAVGAGVPHSSPTAERSIALWHHTRRNGPCFAPALRGETRRNGLRWLRGGGIGGGRGVRGDETGSGGGDAHAAGGKTAISDGGRISPRYRRGGGGGNRHVRLRPPDAQRPQRLRLYLPPADSPRP